VSEFFKFVGGSAVLLAAVAWLIRSLVVHLLDKDIAVFRKDLERQAFEHEVRYRRVDEFVAEHLEEVYKRLLALYQAVGDYVQDVELAGESKV